MAPDISPLPLDYQFPEDAYWHVIRFLRLTLPPPPDAGPEALLRRDHAAIARIAGLAPVSTAEVDFAAQYVAASEQWKDCLRSIQEPGITREWAAKCRAQAACMMREANSAMRVLLQMQSARRKLEADGVLSARADRIDHALTRAFAEALAPPPRAAAAAAPSPAAPAPSPAPVQTGAAPGAAPVAAASPVRVPALELAEAPNPDPLAEAEQYAALYPERAALIRRFGRVPADASFGPPDADLVQTLVTARTPALLALDRACAAARAA
ncbi:MAG: hypothetical protein JO047_03445 [Alphaproteobacteria bacterium]|nr:hypothetical protein [Alphaproteobacteria bacterium]